MPCRYTDDQLAAVLRRCAQGEDTLGRRAYGSRRRPGDPHHHTFEVRFGSWGSALAFAGLVPTAQPFDLAGTTPSWSDDELVQALGDCARETGSTALAPYRAWRDSSPDPSRLPSADAVIYRFGSWRAAIEWAHSSLSSLTASGAA